MRILITGGAGCLGSNLLEKFLPEGHNVLVLDNFATGNREVLPSNLPNLEIVEGSIADKSCVDTCFDTFKPTHVIHSAAAYKNPNDWLEDSATNVDGTVNTLKAAERHEVERFIYFQTALCYGNPEEVPIPVNHPTRPLASYGISKTAGEQYVLLSDLPTISLRLANITAPRLAIGPIPTFYKHLKAGQNCFCSDTIRDFLDISDFMKLMEIIMTANKAKGVFNVSTGQGHSIKDVYDAVVNYLEIKLEKKVPIVPPGEDDVPSVVLDPSKTEEVFKWKAKLSFTESINKMLGWYDAHGISAIYSHLVSQSK